MAEIERTKAMRESRRLSSEQKRGQVMAALKAMLERGEEVSISALARRAGVGRTFIYENPDIRAEIELHIRESQEQVAAGMMASARVSSASLRAELENYKAINRRQKGEIGALRARLGELMGEKLMEDMPEVSFGAFDQKADAELTKLEGDKFQLEERVAVLEEELEAAREVNRKLMGRLNREGSDARTI